MEHVIPYVSDDIVRNGGIFYVLKGNTNTPILSSRTYTQKRTREGAPLWMFH